MGALSRIFKPISVAAAAFFRHDLALRRGRQGVEIVLEPRLPDGIKPSRKNAVVDEARRKARGELDLLLTQLKELLDEVPETRVALKQLVFVEHALQKKGLKALHKLPLPVLQKALEQFEGLVTNWSPAGLANLRSKMAVAIIDHPEVDSISDDEALAAAYAALGSMAPAGVIELQGELGSTSTRALAMPPPRPTESAGEIQIRKLEATASI